MLGMSLHALQCLAANTVYGPKSYGDSQTFNIVESASSLLPLSSLAQADSGLPLRPTDITVLFY